MLLVSVSVSRAGRAEHGTSGAARLVRGCSGGSAGCPGPGGRAAVSRQRGRGADGGAVAARGAVAGGGRRRGAQPGAAGGAGRLAAAGAARLPLRAGLVLGLHPGRARRLLHRPGAGPRPRRAPQPPVQVRGPPRREGSAGPLWGCAGRGSCPDLGRESRGMPSEAWRSSLEPCSLAGSALSRACRWQLELLGLEPSDASHRGDACTG